MPKPKTFGELVTFTPLFDEVIDAFRDTTEKGKQGPFIEALVFGLIWRRCQGDLGIFYMTLQNGADTLGLSKSTFQRALTKLLDAGFIFKSNGYLKIKGSSGRPLAIYSIYPELLEAIDQLENITLTLDEILPISQSSQRDHFKVVRETTSKWSERPQKKEHKEREQESNVVINLLKSYGITGKPLQEFVGLSEKRVRDVITHSKGRPNPQGFIVSALRNEWELKSNRVDPDSPEFRQKYAKDAQELIE